MNKKTFASVTGIMAWTGNKNSIRYLDGDEKLPFVYKDNLYQYFTYNGKEYSLAMTSTFDISEQK